MKAIVNAPFRYPELNVGSYYYGLAHEAQKNEWYLNYLKGQVKNCNYVILDNAADELGEGMTGDGLWDLVQNLGPSELILPDVLQDSEATLKNSHDFYNKYLTSGTTHRGKSLMAVPQGSTLRSWWDCFDDFNNWDAVDVLGIPYDIEFDVPADEFVLPLSLVSLADTKTVKRAKRRLNLVRYLYAGGQLNKPIHLLGMNNLSELRAHNRDHGHLIRSNDTTAPFASNRVWIDGDSGEKNWTPLDFDVEWTAREYRMALRNLFSYIGACNDLRAMYKFTAVNETSRAHHRVSFTEDEWSHI